MNPFRDVLALLGGANVPLPRNGDHLLDGVVAFARAFEKRKFVRPEGSDKSFTGEVVELYRATLSSPTATAGTVLSSSLLPEVV